MGRWLSSASLVACGQLKFGKPTDTKRLAVVARGLHSLRWKVAYEKGIIGFDVRVDDAGSDERFGRYPRVRGWGRVLGTLLGYPYPAYAYYGYGYPVAGQVKLDTKVKNAEVFIDGAFAGMTQQTKSMHLRPGSYNIEIRELGQTKFVEQVYVVPGRTLHLHPQL